MDPLRIAGVANAHPGAAEVGTQMGNGTADAVLPSGTAAFLHPETAGGQVDLVMKDDYPVHRHLVKAGCLADRAATFVHECLGLHQEDFLTLDLAVLDLRLELGLLGTEAPAVRDFVSGHEADVVTVVFVFCAGIAQASDDDHALVMPPEAGKEKPRQAIPDGADSQSV